MIEENKHINYSAADIEKYRKGAMSPADMHAMEKAALEDPFLADAMEGYGVGNEENKVAQDDIQPAIAELRQRLAERVSEKEKTRVIKFGWWKVAAVVLVIMGAGWLYNNYSSKNKEANSNIVKNKDIKEEIPSTAKTDSITNLSASDTSVAMHDVASAGKKSPAAKVNVSSLYKVKDTNSDSAAVAISNAAPSAKNKTIAAEQEQDAPEKSSRRDERAAAKPGEDKAIAANTPKKDSPTADDVNKQADNKSVAGNIERRAEGISTMANKQPAANGKANNAYVNTFNGTIVDQSNRAIPNASIQIPNLNIATQTNKRGNFSFRAPDTALSVSIASEGFETQNLDLTYNNISRPNNLITLKPRLLSVNDSTLNTGSKEKAKKRSVIKAKDISIKILDAEPVIGWNAYNEYLEKNKRVTEETKGIHGNVIITFEVHSKWIGSFVIQQSLNEDLDEEAIRLIKQGPAWKLLKDKKATVSVMVSF